MRSTALLPLNIVAFKYVNPISFDFMESVLKIEPERYGVFGFDENGRVTSIIEKPQDSQLNYAVTGLYFVDETAPVRGKRLSPSARGELEITDLSNSYLN